MGKKLTHSEFVSRARNVHGGKYDYKDLYYTMHAKLHITCPVHGDFEQEPGEHLKGYGCAQCAVVGRTKSRDQFIVDADRVHGDKYYYGVYHNTHRKMAIQCPKHGWFYQAPHKHLRGHECPACNHTRHSNVAVKWLSRIDAEIQHAENGGEFFIAGIGKVDGYCNTTHTVYEFHGDRFHGNPALFEESENCHPFNPDITAGELYQKTIEREQQIRDAGYNLVVMWESDFLGEK